MAPDSPPPAAARGAAPAAPASGRRGPSLTRKLFLIGVAAVAGALLAEWGLRASNLERLSYTNPALYEPDAELGYRMKPNVRVYSHGAWYETNRAGLRGPHWDDVHAAGKDTVVFIGHSIGGGFGVTAEEAFPGVFTELSSLDLVAINMGHSGYRYWQEFPLTQQYLGQIDPAATVVMFTGNEFEPQYDPFTPTNIDGDGGEVPIPGKRWLRRNSALYSYLRKGWTRLQVAVGRRAGVRVLEYDRLKGETEESREHYAAYEEHLRRLKDDSGVPMVFTAFPMGQSAQSYAVLRGIAERVGARWVDLSDLWKDVQEYRREGALAWSEHPNAATHRIIGERVTTAVEELLTAGAGQ